MTNRRMETIARLSALAALRTACLVGAAWLPALVACGGLAREEGQVQDGAPPADATKVGQSTPAKDALAEDARSTGARDGQEDAELSDAMVLLPIQSPPASDDMRLVGFAMGNMGATPNGWDFCQGPPGVSLTRCPYGCDGAPPASRGSGYFRFTGPSGAKLNCSPACPDAQDCHCPDAQIYAYFTPPIAPNREQGLWFDLIRLAGDPLDATLTIYATLACDTVSTFGTWSIAEVLSEPQVWKTTCVNLVPSASVGELGFRIAGSSVDVGMDALRFGPACPY
jgi:hypothetical protein